MWSHQTIAAIRRCRFRSQRIVSRAPARPGREARRRRGILRVRGGGQRPRSQSGPRSSRRRRMLESRSAAACGVGKECFAYRRVRRVGI
eukprot:5364588-Pleurochrysis_carterae.AAC.3